MDVRQISTVAQWDALETDWKHIAAASPSATVFQTWEWTRTWWTHWGSGGSKRLQVLVFTENNAVVGFAPLFVTPLNRTARFVGTGGSDYLDLLALPGHETGVAQAFWEWTHMEKHAWDWLDLQQVRPGAVVSICRPDTGVELWPGETCPFLPLTSDWESFRKTLGKKLRSNLGYYERALEKRFVIEHRVATADTLANDLDDFFALHQKRWNQRWLPGAFASRRARAFHEAVARALLGAGMLRLHTIFLDGVARASLYCFQKGDACAYYLGGFEPIMARWSIGTVLTARAIRHALEQDDAAQFDFLRGDEPYKYRWGAQDRGNRRFSMTRPGVFRSGALLAWAGRALFSAERRLKTWMHARHGGG